MSSTNVVDFSVRQNKAIERELVFQGLQQLKPVLGLSAAQYIGLGSVWFTDFLMAHVQLGIDRLVSVESDAVIYERARFNRPFSCVEVVHGPSHEVLPGLVADKGLRTLPRIVWLDFDKALDLDRLDELSALAGSLPDDSVLITTFSAAGRKYGKPIEIEATLLELFGDDFTIEGDVTNDLDRGMNLVRGVQRALSSAAADFGRSAPAVPAFGIVYRDAVPMVTTGVVLPSPATASEVRAAVEREDWPARSSSLLATPPLTSKEAASLRALLPAANPLTRDDVRAIGFDLEDDQVESFARNYRYFPSFAQVLR